jgi:hypothetical protein
LAPLCGVVKSRLINPLHRRVVSRASRVNFNIPNMSRILVCREFDVGGHIVVVLEVKVEAESVNEVAASVKELAASVKVVVVEV